MNHTDTSQIVPVGLKSLRRLVDPPMLAPAFSSYSRRERKKETTKGTCFSLSFYISFPLIGCGSSAGWKCPHKTNAFCVFVSLVRPFLHFQLDLSFFTSSPLYASPSIIHFFSFIFIRLFHRLQLLVILYQSGQKSWPAALLRLSLSFLLNTFRPDFPLSIWHLVSRF